MVEGMIKDICGQDLLSSVTKVLGYDVFTDSRFSGAIVIVKKISNDIIVPVAIMLVCMYFLINVLDKFSSDNFNWEQLGRLLASLLIGVFLIENSFAILEQLFYLGDILVEELAALSGTPDFEKWSETGLNIYKEQREGQIFLMDWIWDIVMIPVFIIPWLFSWVMRLAVKVICYSRLIEIMLRTAFAPVALSDVFHHGLNGGGWRFLKNFLAVCLQGVLIVAICCLFNSIVNGLVADEMGEGSLIGWMGGIFSFLGIWLTVYASALMLMFRSLSLSKEIVGTGG